MSAPEPAEVTAARAALADFRRWDRGEIIRGDWMDWSLRLARHLDDVLGAVTAQMPRPRIDGSVGATCVLMDGTASIAAADLGTVLGALQLAAEVGDSADRFAYRALARALGDDR